MSSANALVIETSPGTTAGTFKVKIQSVDITGGSLGQFDVDNLSPTLLPLTFQAAIIAATKAHWGMGLLDTVRLIGSDIL